MMNREMGQWKDFAKEEPTEPKEIFATMSAAEQQKVQELFEEDNKKARAEKKKETLAKAFSEDKPGTRSKELPGEKAFDLNKEELDRNFANAVRAVYRERNQEPRPGEHIAA